LLPQGEEDLAGKEAASMRRRGEEESGVTDDLIGSVFRAMRAALGEDRLHAVPYPMEWGQWDEAYVEAFEFSIRLMKAEIEGAEGVPWAVLAAKAYEWFRVGLGDTDFEPFGTIPEQSRNVWEVAARHMANLLGGFEEGEDGTLSDHENRWESWIRERAKRLTLPAKGER
jgi:hypothetical protein